MGKWDNFQEMEIKLSLPELEHIVTAARERELRQQKFAAALKGINLDEETDAVDRVEEMKRRIEAERAGVSVDTLDFMDMGIDVESD